MHGKRRLPMHVDFRRIEYRPNLDIKLLVDLLELDHI